MFSFIAITATLTVAGISRVEGRAIQAPTPVVTPAPTVLEYEELIKRQDPDAVSLAQVLLTAVPESLRQIAATNVPAASTILWEQFLDDKKPAWFLQLPRDIQTYLIKRFGPSTAIPTATAPDGSSSDFIWPTETASEPLQSASSQPIQISASQPVPASQNPSQSASPSRSQYLSSELPESTPPTSVTATSLQSTAPAPPNTISTMSTKVGAISSTPSASATPESSSSSAPTAPPAPTVMKAPGLTQSQKLGIGLGVPLGLITALALAFGCLALYRRRQRKKVDGSLPPSSPGFIPRFAFQEKPIQEPSQRLLNPAAGTSTTDLLNMGWDEEVIDTSSSGESVPTLSNNQIYSNKPVMAPALFHTHSSNRARGKRTSYTSLHSVAEVSEPDDDKAVAMAESPVLPRSSPPNRFSPPRSLIPLPTPAPSHIKRKPVGSPPNIKTPSPPAAQLASQTLLQQTMPGPSRPITRLSTTFGEPVGSSRNVSPYVSPPEEYHPIPTNSSSNPRTTHTYEEDYGPEYYDAHHSPSCNNNDRGSNNNMDNDYLDTYNTLYGGNNSLSRYPEPRKNSPKSLRTEWPLRNFTNSHHRRKSSPLWERRDES